MRTAPRLELRRDEAGRRSGAAGGPAVQRHRGLIALAALALSTAVTVGLGRAVLVPVRELARSVEAIRCDDLAYRVPVRSEDELGQLAEGFNRMAETLAEYRHSSLGELLLAKATLEATLAALPDAVVVVDPDGPIVSKNPLADELLHALGDSGSTNIRDLPLKADVLGAVEAALRGEHAAIEVA